MDSLNKNELKWDWVPCNYNLIKKVDNKEIIWNLKPSIILTNPSQEDCDPNVKLFIDTEKSLQYSNELGWNWHKSWNLPNISVRIEIKDSQTGETLLSPKNLFVHLFAVKAVLDENDYLNLVEVGLKGINRIELIDGHAFFSALKFASTSYNNEGVKFHLAICLYIMNEDETVPKILNSSISPAIFVDSRKSARDSHLIMEKKLISFIELFHPEIIDKIFIKRENKKKNDAEISVQNDLDGLFNYLTAPNIRHKVKHPVFLSVKFQDCIQLYYNSTLIEDDSIQNLIYLIHKKINEERGQKKDCSSSVTKYECVYFIMNIKEHSEAYKNKKIFESLEPLRTKFFDVQYQTNFNMENFKQITEIKQLKTVYKQNYQILVNQFNQMKYNDEKSDQSFNNSENNNKKESSDSYSMYENVPMKKVKKNEDFNEDLSESSQLNQRNQKMLMINQDILAPPQNHQEQQNNQNENNASENNEILSTNSVNQKKKEQSQAKSQGFQKHQENKSQNNSHQINGQNGGFTQNQSLQSQINNLEFQKKQQNQLTAEQILQQQQQHPQLEQFQLQQLLHLQQQQQSQLNQSQFQQNFMKLNQNQQIPSNINPQNINAINQMMMQRGMTPQRMMPLNMMQQQQPNKFPNQQTIDPMMLNLMQNQNMQQSNLQAMLQQMQTQQMMQPMMGMGMGMPQMPPQYGGAINLSALQMMLQMQQNQLGVQQGLQFPTTGYDGMIKNDMIKKENDIKK